MAAASELAAVQAAPDRLGLALRYAKAGIPVFPLEPGAKTPRKGSHGHKDATREEAIIRQWFSDDPEMNWGAVGGAERFNPITDETEHLVWIDLDRHGAKDGLRSFTNACQAAGIDPRGINTLEVETPNGGLHLGFWTAQAIRHGVDVLGEGSGVDVRSEGKGYVVGPGSALDGRPYRIVNDAPIADMGKLAGLFPTGTAEAKPVDRTPLPGVDPARAEDRARDYLKTAPVSIKGQGGDQTALKVAARLKDLGCTEPETLDLMLSEHWHNGCGWTPERLATKVSNAFRYGQNPPGSSAPEAIFAAFVEPPDPEAPPKPARPAALEVLRWSELKDTPVPEVQWIWKPFFPRVSFGALVSHPGHGKSWLSLQIAVAVATGLPIFGEHTCGPAGAGVLALEDDKHVLHRRLKSIREGYGLAWTERHDTLLDQNLRAMVRARAPLEGLGQAAAAHELAQLAAELGRAMANTQDPPAVLFLDTLNAIHSGDENSNTETRQLAATIFGIGDTLNCSVWALHHLRKTGTGKQATALMDRMNPELVRGASAIVGSTRAVAQFGWITSGDATKAGLDPEGAERRYAILGLTKINDGPLSPWLLIEHQRSNGLMVPTHEGEKALAILRGGNAVKALKKYEALLLDIHAELTMAELIARHYPDDPRGKDKLKAAVSDLRTRHGWIERGVYNRTEAGLKKVLELQGRQAVETCLPDSEETED